MSVESFIKQITESEDFRVFEEEMGISDVGNVTSNIDGYQTPNAFSPSEEDFEESSKDRAEVFGYKTVGKLQNKHRKKVYATESSAYKQAMEQLTEISYNDFKLDQTKTSTRKINDSIRHINSKVYEVERVIKHALKLKTEMSVDQRNLWRSSISKLVKIAERITRISKNIHELGA
jgi:hypothetical protein